MRLVRLPWCVLPFSTVPCASAIHSFLSSRYTTCPPRRTVQLVRTGVSTHLGRLCAERSLLCGCRFSFMSIVIISLQSIFSYSFKIVCWECSASVSDSLKDIFELQGAYNSTWTWYLLRWLYHCLTMFNVTI